MSSNSPCRPLLILSYAVLMLALCANSWSSQPLETLKLGMSTALSGPTSALGANMKAGVLAAIAEVNAKGGIRGQRFELVALDDGYEPKLTTPNMRYLTSRNDVIAIIGNVGTPTAVAAVPIALQSATPFIGAYTGAGILRKAPPERYIINYRASYAEETREMVSALIQEGGLKPSEIAFFTQRDAYGDSGFIGGINALMDAGLQSAQGIAHGRYERNTLAVENGLADILQARTTARAIIMVGAYAPNAEFIRLARQFGYRGVFLNVSFVGAEPLLRTLGEDGEGVIVTQVVPHYAADLPVVKSYRRALEVVAPNREPSFVSLEGYVTGTILFRSLEHFSTEINRESVIDALEAMNDFDIGLGVPLHLSPQQHQASHSIWPTIIREQRVVPFRWRDLPQLIDGQD